MQKSCLNPWCQQPFEVTDADLAFYEKVSPVFNGKKELIPPPTRCPECRARTRMTWRNERALFQSQCAQCNTSTVTMFPPETSVQNLCENCWRSDAFQPLKYGKDLSGDTTIISQILHHFHNVPHRGLFITGFSENSRYINWAGPCKNCYLVFNSGLTEDCYYAKGLIGSENCADMLTCSKCSQCYECINVNESTNLLFSQNCTQCHDGAFLYNCIGCHDCILCSNMHHQSYCIMNKQYTQEEYAHMRSHFLSSGSNFAIQEALKKYESLVTSSIHRFRQSHNDEDSTGDFLFSAKNCRACFEATNAEDCAFMDCSKRCKNCYDLYGFAYDSELLYQCVGVGYSFLALGCVQCERSQNAIYCFQCADIQNCTGCIGLQRAQFCILNKQYTKEEYERLVPKIIEKMRADGEWGEFFPPSMSPFGYNETVAQEYFPLTKEQALERGFLWSDYKPPMPKADRIIKAEQLPDSIDDVPDDILQWAIECEVTKRPFKIIKQELDFYRTMRLPVPRLHPDERHRRRMALRNPRKLWDRECAKCQKPISTSYSPERPEIVVCERCYLEAVY